MSHLRRFSIVCLLFITFLCLTSCSSTAPTATATQIPSTPTQKPTSTAPTATATQIPSTPTQEPSPTTIPTKEPILVLSRNYIVQQSDTLTDISSLYGIPVTSIVAYNNIFDANTIFTGQILIIPDSSYIPPENINSDKKIVIILSLQKLYAYEGDNLIADFLVSTGLPDTPTVLGTYHTYLKFEATNMVGPGYNLKDVPWTMYFYKGYGIHGTFWHSNFGHPMSHGCVNMETSEAKWLYDWAPLGITVEVLP